MSLITERSYRDECVSPTIDVIQLIRIRRAKWLKMNLTYNSKSLIVQVFADKAYTIGQKEMCSLTCLMYTSMHLKINSTMIIIRNGERSLNLSNLTQLEISDL